MVFEDRKDAGDLLAEKLSKEITTIKGCILLALPRGGIPVAIEIHKKLNIPLDILISRKLGAPGNPEFGIGAISENNSIYLNSKIIKEYGISKKYIEEITLKGKKDYIENNIEEIKNLIDFNKKYPLIN